MITVSDTARALINSGRFVYHVSASSWLGDELLAEDVPIDSGSEEGDRTLNVPERIQLTVPRRAFGMDWTPTSDTSPLAARDQTLKISLGVGQGADGVEWFQRGEFVIISTEPQSTTTLQVTCAGMLTLVDEAKFAGPFQPTGTIGGTLRKLIEPAVLADLTDAPQDRSIALTAINWDTDRLGAVNAVLDAWPADAVMTEQGVLRVIPTVPPTVAVRTFTDDASSGTLVSAAGSSVRGEPVDTVLVTGYNLDGAEVRAQARRRTVGGRRGDLANFYGVGPMLPVVSKISSGLLNTTVQASAAALALLDRELRRYARKRLVVETTPDPTIQLGDCVGVWSEGVWTLGTVENLQLPYKPGPMRLEVVSLT